jgi:hypothetical protein
MLSVQSKAINQRFVFSWLPPDVLTGWPALPKSSFINQRFGWLCHAHGNNIYGQLRKYIHIM